MIKLCKTWVRLGVQQLFCELSDRQGDLRCVWNLTNSRFVLNVLPSGEDFRDEEFLLEFKSTCSAKSYILSLFFWLEIIHENLYTVTFLSIPVTHVFHSIRISNACSNRWNTFQKLTDFDEFRIFLRKLICIKYITWSYWVRSGQNYWSKWKNIFIYI